MATTAAAAALCSDPTATGTQVPPSHPARPVQLSSATHGPESGSGGRLGIQNQVPNKQTLHTKTPPETCDTERDLREGGWLCGGEPSLVQHKEESHEWLG